MNLQEFEEKFNVRLAHKIRSAIVDSRFTPHPFLTGWLRSHWIVDKLSDGRQAVGNVVEYGPDVEARTGFVLKTISRTKELAYEVLREMVGESAGK